MEARDIPSRIVADVVVASGEDLRNWRTLGYLDGIGERVGLPIRFSYREVLMVGLGATLARGGLGLADAFKMIANPRPEIVAALAGHGGTLILQPRRPQGVLACSVTLTFDLAGIISDVTKRLDIALEAERCRSRGRFAFEPVPAAASHR